jgi:hypothetical protein
MVLLALVVVLPGCTRPFFRQRADHEVAEVLQEKDVEPAWALNNYYVYPHPLARFADPSNPDRPPMPPDDPAAWYLAPQPQKPKHVAYFEGTGYLDVLAAWDAENRQRLGLPPPRGPADAAVQQASADAAPAGPTPDDPVWQVAGAQRSAASAPLETLGMRQDPFIINLEQAVELAFFNSRDFQTRREALYLSALPVTLERFAFLPQFEATQSAIREWAGRQAPTGPQNRWQVNTTVGANKLFTNGALLMLQLANRTTLNLTGDEPHTLSQSTLLLDFVQPLLRGGGRAVALEPLTQAERDLLYDLRSFARFHREFFVNIAAGGPTVAGIGGQLVVRGQAAPIGYFPTLLRQAQLENEIQNQQALEALFDRYQAYVEGNIVSPLQADQVDQDRQSARTRVLESAVRYNDAVDQFKIQLGLPPHLPLRLDTTPILPLREQMQRYEAVILSYRNEARLIDQLGIEVAPPEEVREAIKYSLTQSPFVAGTRLQEYVRRRWDFWEWLSGGIGREPPPPLSGLGALASQRYPLALGLLESLAEERANLLFRRYEDAGKPSQVTPNGAERLRFVSLELELGSLQLALRTYEQQPWLQVPLVDRRRVQLGLFLDVSNRYIQLLTEAQAERLDDLEDEWPELPPVYVHGVDLLKVGENEAADLELEAQALYVAGRVALTNRLDLMNQRASLVDAWRRIAVFANSLLGTFDVRYHMEVVTPPPQIAQPLDFDGTRSRHQLFLNTELPLVRKLERNNYRASLIAYQRQRRALMQAEDNILFQIRQNVRELRRLRRTYQIQQRALVLAYRVRDNAEDALVAAEPGGQRDAATAAAALTQQLLNAQSRIPQAQNAVFSVWIDYINTRMELYRDLELLRVDSRGVWIDELTAPSDAAPPRPDQPADPSAPGP